MLFKHEPIPTRLSPSVTPGHLPQPLSPQRHSPITTVHATYPSDNHSTVGHQSDDEEKTWSGDLISTISINQPRTNSAFITRRDTKWQQDNPDAPKTWPVNWRTDVLAHNVYRLFLFVNSLMLQPLSPQFQWQFSTVPGLTGSSLVYFLHFFLKTCSEHKWHMFCTDQMSANQQCHRLRTHHQSTFTQPSLRHQ